MHFLRIYMATARLRNQGGRGSAVLTPSSLLQLKPFSPRFSTPAGASVALKAGYIFKLAEKSDCGVNITLTTFSQDAGDRRVLVGGARFSCKTASGLWAGLWHPYGPSKLLRGS